MLLTQELKVTVNVYLDSSNQGADF